MTLKKKQAKPPHLKNIPAQKQPNSGKLVILFFALSIIFIVAYLMVPEGNTYQKQRILPAYQLYQKGMFDSSYSLLQQYKKDHTANYNDSLYLLESSYHLKKNNLSEAINVLKEGITATDSSSAKLYFKLGKVLLQDNNPGEALRDYFNGLVIQPTYDSAWYYCGYIQATLTNDYENAIKSFEQALILNPEYKYSFNTLLWRGIAFQEIGDQTRAMRQFDQAIKLTTENDLAKHYKAKSMLLTGDSTSACALWQALNKDQFELAKLALDAYCN